MENEGCCEKLGGGGEGGGRGKGGRLLITEGCTKYKFKHGNGTAKRNAHIL